MDQDDAKLHACNDDCVAASGSTPAQFFGARRAGEKRVCYCECHSWNKRSADIITADQDIFTPEQHYRMNEALFKAQQRSPFTQAEIAAWREKCKQSDAYLRGEMI